MYNSTTTLKAIRAAKPCEEGWSKLLAGLGKTKADGAPLDLLTVLNINGLDDALWVLSYAMPDDRLARHFQAWFADQVLHLFEVGHPNDTRVRDQIAMLRNDAASPHDRAAARAAAWAAARTAAGTAARTAARAAAWAAAWDAAGDAAGTAAWAAARAAAGTAAWDAAWDAAEIGGGAAQENQLRQMLTEV